MDENVLATGDDEGTLKVWDMRKGTAIMDLKHHEDFISEIAIDEAKKILLTSRWKSLNSPFGSKLIYLRRLKCNYMMDTEDFKLTC